MALTVEGILVVCFLYENFSIFVLLKPWIIFVLLYDKKNYLVKQFKTPLKVFSSWPVIQHEGYHVTVKCFMIGCYFTCVTGMMIGSIFTFAFSGFICFIPIHNGWPFIFYVFCKYTKSISPVLNMIFFLSLWYAQEILHS